MKKNRLLKKRNFIHLSFLLPSLAGVAVFIFMPFVDSVRRSFFSSVTREFTGIKNYKNVFDTGAFVLAVKNTALFTAACLPILIILSFFISFFLCKMRFIRVIKSVLLFPLAIPTAALVMIWKILFSDTGYVNTVLNYAGASGINFLGTRAAFWVLVGSYIWKNLGYTVVLWMTGMMSVSSSQLDAAKTDGASELQCLFYISLPSLKPTLYTITIISFLNSFKVFREAYLVAGSYPDKSIYMLQHLFNNWFVNLELDKMAAAAVCIFTVIFVAIILLKYAWDKEEQL